MRPADIRGRIEKPYPERAGARVDGQDVRELLRGVVEDMLFGRDAEADGYLDDPECAVEEKKFRAGVEVQAPSRRLAGDWYRRVEFTLGLVHRPTTGGCAATCRRQGRRGRVTGGPIGWGRLLSSRFWRCVPAPQAVRDSVVSAA
jgi:hypothetical protein